MAAPMSSASTPGTTTIATSVNAKLLNGTQNAAVPPAEHEAEGHEGVGQILAPQIEAKAIEAGREDDEQEQRKDDEVKVFSLSKVHHESCGQVPERVRP